MSEQATEIVRLTKGQCDNLIRALFEPNDDCAHNMLPLYVAVERIVADRVEVARAEAREQERARIAGDLRQYAGPAWGGHASWLTTGKKVAELAAGWVEDTETKEADRG